MDKMKAGACCSTPTRPEDLLTGICSACATARPSFAVSGTYDTIGAKIEERYQGLLERTSLYQPYPVDAGNSGPPALIHSFNG